MIAAAEGLYGARIAKDVKYNRLVNDVGSKNTNKAMDLKVRHILRLAFLEKFMLCRLNMRTSVGKRGHKV